MGGKALVRSLYVVSVARYLAGYIVAFCLFCTDVLRCVWSQFNKPFSPPLPPFSLFRCCIRLPAPQPSPQRPRSSDAGHPQASHWARLPPACSAAPPVGRLDQGRRCAAALANEAARRCAGGGHPESRHHHRSYLSFANDVCRADWGNDDQESCMCSYVFGVPFFFKWFPSLLAWNVKCDCSTAWWQQTHGRGLSI